MRYNIYFGGDSDWGCSDYGSTDWELALTNVAKAFVNGAVNDTLEKYPFFEHMQIEEVT